MTAGNGASGIEPASLAVENGALVFLVERAGVGKTLVTVQTKPGPDAWPAILSQHTWVGGQVGAKLMSGGCRLRTAP